MASEDEDFVAMSPNLFCLEDADEYEDLLGTQCPNDNPDLPLLDLDEDFLSQAAEQPVPQTQQTVQQPQQEVHPPRPTHQLEAPNSRRRPPRLSIPDNADIIDLDSLETDGRHHDSARQGPLTFIKAEDQDVILLSNDTTPQVKTEHLETNSIWKFMPEQYIDLVGSDEEANVNAHNRTDSTRVKQESEEQWTWAEMQHEVIELLDSGDENFSDKPLNTITADRSNLAERLKQDATSRVAPSSRPSRAVLQGSNTKAKRTPADRARLMQLQRLYAERALGKQVVVGAGGIFKGPSGSAPKNCVSSNAENELAWMDVNADVNEDAEIAAKFVELKTKYNRKKYAGRNTFEDDVLFMKAESAEKARLKRLDDDYHRTPGPMHSEDLEENLSLSEGELFVRQSPPSTSSLKRSYATTIQSDDDNVITVESDANQSDPDAYITRKPQSKRKRAKELEKELHDSMMAGIEMDMARDQKRAGRKAKVSRKDSANGTLNNRKSRKKGPGESKGKESGLSGKKSKVKKGKSNEAKKPKPTQEGYLSNLGSLFTSNIYEDANLNRPSLTITDTLIKEQALKSLLAGVPLEDLKTARAEKQHIQRATKTLGARKVKADGKGGWKFKGMTSSLYNHQVQGAAWMRERETGDIEPLGGLQADEMGLGKTVMTIACMVSNPPAPDSASRCTLIVCTSALVTQWESEIRKHTEPAVFPAMFKYHAKEFAKIFGRGAERVVQKADVVITSYHEVFRSYPKYRPPLNIMLPEKKREWWTEAYEANRSILHRVHFHRIVLDEAQAIKNHMSQISVACRGLMGKHRWAISGTPIQNRVEEFFPFFKFLRVPHTGTFEVFKENFAEPDSNDATDRLHSFLKRFMIRRTHRDTLFGSALVEMPKNTQRTVVLEFNEVERAIYEAVRTRYIQKINRNSRDGVLEKSYSNVLTMLLRLRQLTAHPFMLQKTIEDLFELEDIEKLWEVTAPEVTADDNPARDMLITMKKMMAEKDKPAEAVQATEPVQTTEPVSVEDSVEDRSSGESAPLVFKFRRFLRDLAQSSKWDDLKNRSLCHKCRDPPDEPWVTSCLHVYCKECLNALAYEATKRGEEETTCLDCGTIYTESRACDGLKELQMDAEASGRTSPESSQTTRTRRDPEQDLKWINFNGATLPSTKTAAVQAQIEMWLEIEPDKKVIVFSQFYMLMKILGRLFQQRGWKSVSYHGQMTHEARDNAINTFRDDPNIKIMIASLKCGGVGLNLTMASRVICVDLWWNSSVEQQAFCRVFRIGQASETFITRLVVKNTVDEKLQTLQDSKQEAIGVAIDDSKMLDKLSLTDLMKLFGPVQIGEDRKPFIMVDDEKEYDSAIPPIL